MDFSSWQDARSRDPRRIALGSAGWGQPYGVASLGTPPDPEELKKLLAHAREAGVRTIDTARAYGESEARIGQAIAGEGDWRIVTKLDAGAHQAGDDLLLALDKTRTSLTASAEALRLDGLPTLLLHRFAHRHACGGRLWRLLLAERDAGRIGALGVSAATPEEAWAALEDPDIEVLQVATSLLDRRLFQQGFFVRARELGRSVFVRSVYLQGIAHLGSEALPGALAGLGPALEMIRGAARELGVAPRALFLGFARELPGVMPVLGVERQAQLEQNLADWRSDSVSMGDLLQLADQLPAVPEALLDPARWPPFDPGSARRPGANQTTPASVATF